MPNDLTIHPIPSVLAASEAHGEPRHENIAPPAAAASGSTAQPYVNPSLRLDAALGLVVIEFHDEAGKLTSSIPSQRQIDAYRRHEDTRPGQQRTEGRSEEPTRADEPSEPKPAPPVQDSSTKDG
jgi:hypothetical protein